MFKLYIVYIFNSETLDATIEFYSRYEDDFYTYISRHGVIREGSYEHYIALNGDRQTEVFTFDTEKELGEFESRSGLI